MDILLRIIKIITDMDSAVSCPDQEQDKKHFHFHPRWYCCQNPSETTTFVMCNQGCIKTVLIVYSEMGY